MKRKYGSEVKGWKRKETVEVITRVEVAGGRNFFGLRDACRGWSGLVRSHGVSFGASSRWNRNRISPELCRLLSCRAPGVQGSCVAQKGQRSPAVWRVYSPATSSAATCGLVVAQPASPLQPFPALSCHGVRWGEAHAGCPLWAFGKATTNIGRA